MRLLASPPLRLLAFVNVCARLPGLFAFAHFCLCPPLLRPPLRASENQTCTKSWLPFCVAFTTLFPNGQ